MYTERLQQQAQRAFAYTMLDVWNNLPLGIESFTSPLHIKPSNVTLQPTYSVHYTALNTVSTHLATASALDLAC